MRTKIDRRALFSLLLLSFGGLLGGFTGGLLGAGGGIIFTLVLSFLLPKDTEGRRSVFACSLSVTLPLAAITLVRYSASGKLALSPQGKDGPLFLLPMLLGALAGGAVGGILLGRLRSGALRRIFALLCALSGLLMLF